MVRFCGQEYFFLIGLSQKTYNRLNMNRILIGKNSQIVSCLQNTFNDKKHTCLFMIGVL